jgi:2-C-methyl-D-erythritol 4-phosphate cytidylyltransferase
VLTKIEPRDPREHPGGLVPSLGVVLDQDRGSLPFALVHGEPLVACAAWALGEAEVTLVDAGTPWSSLVAGDEPVVLHDPLCPLTPPGFIAGCVVYAAETGQVVVGARPVTDTVKVVEDGRVGATVDRDGLLQVCSPVVLPAEVVAALAGPPGSDLARLVTELAAEFEVTAVEAPPAARRVQSEDDLRLLAALTTR